MNTFTCNEVSFDNMVNIVAENAPLRKKLSEKERKKIRKIYKQCLLNHYNLTNPFEILESIFGSNMFKDIVEKYNNQKLNFNTPV